MYLHLISICIEVRARGLGGYSPSPCWGRQSHNFSDKREIFRAEASIQNEKKYLLNAKCGIHSVLQDEVPEIRDFY